MKLTTPKIGSLYKSRHDDSLWECAALFSKTAATMFFPREIMMVDIVKKTVCLTDEAVFAEEFITNHNEVKNV